MRSRTLAALTGCILVACGGAGRAGFESVADGSADATSEADSGDGATGDATTHADAGDSSVPHDASADGPPADAADGAAPDAPKDGAKDAGGADSGSLDAAGADATMPDADATASDGAGTDGAGTDGAEPADAAGTGDATGDGQAADAVEEMVDLCLGVTCSPLDACHVAGTCDPSTGLCSDPPAPDGTACDDGDACTQTDVCASGACTGTNPVVCTALDQCYAAGTCDPSTGACSNPPLPDGTSCTLSSQAAQCCTGTCYVTTSCSLTVSLVNPPSGWQDGGDWPTISGTGFGPGVRVYFGDGVAPAWAESANAVVAQTPPHPVGTVDVKVVMGANTAVMPGGFSYLSDGVVPPWSYKPMQYVRSEYPGVSVLQDGRVLVAGGATKTDTPSSALANAEIYDRLTDTVVLAGNGMQTGRWRNSVVTMATGRALVVGGCNGSCPNANDAAADLFDPATDTFSPAHPMNTARNFTKSVLMGDGRVFVSSAGVGSVELYDPLADTFKQIAHSTTHNYGFVVRLRDGRVMIGGGDGGETTVEIFDPWSETFTTTGALNTGRAVLTAHTLPDDRVVVIGGTNVSAGGVNAPQNTMELWNPTTGAWTYAGVKLSTPRCWHASALLRNGTIIVMGGYPTAGSCTATAAVEVFDPVAVTDSVFASLPDPNTEWNAVTLLDGSVIGVGGGACGGAALPDMDFLAGSP